MQNNKYYYITKILTITQVLLIFFCITVISFYIGRFWADYHMKKAVIYSYNRNWDKALKEYKKTIALKPDYTLAYYFMGNVYKDRNVNLRDSFKALGKYQKVIEMSPYYLKVHYQKGIVLSRLGKFRQAEEEFKLSNRLDPIFYLNHLNFDSKNENSFIE